MEPELELPLSSSRSTAWPQSHSSDQHADMSTHRSTGFFKRFGLSNFKAEDVQKVYDICKEKSYPLPEVYQGNYSAVARKQEEVLFPTLRKLGISFYAYSPIAGGFLVKTKQQVLDGAGRFDTSTPIGQMYGGMVRKYYTPPTSPSHQQSRALLTPRRTASPPTSKRSRNGSRSPKTRACPKRIWRTGGSSTIRRWMRNMAMRLLSGHRVRTS